LGGYKNVLIELEKIRHQALRWKTIAGKDFEAIAQILKQREITTM